MADRRTIAAYDLRIGDYVRLTKRTRPHATLMHFIACLPSNGFVLDLGCGPANASAVMREHGLRVDAVDASAEMVQLANATHDISARQATFDELDAVDAYDGVWANFSLLHASPADFPRHLKALHRALVPDGVFHIGMKLGGGEARDRLDRYYAYYSQDELSDHLEHAGFRIDRIVTGEDPGLAGDVEPWIAMTSTATSACP
ncbi:class I SAM-dependent DNA methyltransferase [Hoeflea poritis]|uniref:Class I SAM-dependent methyltransferase n=1 Tax=Hoeflea poritis TaxID=2993659 RepID=A0ABT4VVT3_9HYPH|nr:class I SAM-dependent methyltransferase [Hoeflea poritis]MDA4848803.1 class I SAM-dependent methyltransferase [Hoeflea poritis]